MGEQLDFERAISVIAALMILIAVLTLPSASGDQIQRFVLFGAGHGRHTAASVTSGSLLAIFGSDAIDLSRVSISGQAEIHASTVFGKVDIRVPRHWDVRIDGAPVLGKYIDRTEHPKSDSPVLVVRGNAVLGQVSVHN